MKNILIGVTGSVAATKVTDLAKSLSLFANIRIIATKSAEYFLKSQAAALKELNMTNTLYLPTTYGGNSINNSVCDPVIKNNYLDLIRKSLPDFIKTSCYNYEINCYHPMTIVDIDYQYYGNSKMYGNMILVPYIWYHQLGYLDKHHMINEKKEIFGDLYHKAEYNVIKCNNI